MNFWFLPLLTLPVVIPVIIALIVWYGYVDSARSLPSIDLMVKRPVWHLGALLRAASGSSASSLDNFMMTVRSRCRFGHTCPTAGFWGQVRMEPTP